MGLDASGAAPGGGLHVARRADAADFGTASHGPRTSAVQYGTRVKKQYDFSKGKRRAVIKVPRGKSRITIRLDHDVLDWFRKQVGDAGGGSYQNLINQALRAYTERSEEPLEAIVRRVVREELRRAS